jgi:hypothetical protein
MPRAPSATRVSGHSAKMRRRRRRAAGVVVSYDEFRARRLEVEGKRSLAYRPASSDGDLFRYSLAHEAADATFEATIAAVASQLREDMERRERIPGEVADAATRAYPDEDDLTSVDDFPIASPGTRQAARVLAQRIALAMVHQRFSPIPRFAAGQGVDLYWKTERARMNVAVPADGRGSIEFYCDTRQGESISGTIAENGSIEFLARWFSTHA